MKRNQIICCAGVIAIAVSANVAWAGHVSINNVDLRPEECKIVLINDQGNKITINLPLHPETLKARKTRGIQILPSDKNEAQVAIPDATYVIVELQCTEMSSGQTGKLKKENINCKQGAAITIQANSPVMEIGVNGAGWSREGGESPMCRVTNEERLR